MLGWGKGSDIRATYERRREQIRQGVLGAGRAAGSRINRAGAAAVAGLRATGAAVRAGRDAATAGARRMLGGSAAMAAVVGQKARAAQETLTGVLARSAAPSLVGAAGAMALGAGIGRYRGAGFDGEVLAMFAVGGALLVPTALHLLTVRFPGWAGQASLLTMAVVAVGGLAAAALWSSYRGVPGFTGSAGVDESKEVVGRASVIAGDLLKVGGTTVRLSGIEVPERAQLCGKDGNKWRCAEAAQSALLKVVSGRPVRCTLSGTDQAGRPLGRCSLDSVDVNAELVRQGYAFAESGSRLVAQEKEARSAKAGMWIGDALRPAEAMAKAWEEAKRQAPDGCPIKGQVIGKERVYVLPGAPEYQRARVQTARGDRWFCSEQDAATAGFKAAQRG